MNPEFKLAYDTVALAAYKSGQYETAEFVSFLKVFKVKFLN